MLRAFGAFAEDRNAWLWGRRQGGRGGLARGTGGFACQTRLKHLPASPLPTEALLAMHHSTSQAQTPPHTFSLFKFPTSVLAKGLSQKRPSLQTQQFPLLEVWVPSPVSEAEPLLSCAAFSPDQVRVSLALLA